MQAGAYGVPPSVEGGLERLKPSGWWFVVAAAIGIGGIGAAVAIGVATAMGFSDRIDDFPRADVPGSEKVTLAADGYIVYLEFPGAGDETFGLDPSVDINITGPDGDPVDLEPYGGSATYSTGDHEGSALYTFTAEESGDYTVTIEGEQATIAIGHGVFDGIVGGIVATIAVGILSVGAAALISIIVGVRRSTARTRRQLSLVQTSWPTGPPPR